MSDYYDDDLSYQDDIPEFQDEAEFDDYLNDEEYNLMNQLFPKAIDELQDYQGWDNLSVKLAIFDNNFDFNASIIQLKRQYKKRELKVSILEKIARSKQTHVSNMKGISYKPDNKGVSLLNRLQVPKSKDCKYGSLNLFSKNRETNSFAKNLHSSFTLSSRSEIENVDSIVLTRSSSKDMTKSNINCSINLTNKESKDPWIRFKNFQAKQNNRYAEVDNLEPYSTVSLIITSILPQKIVDGGIERQFGNIFTVYHPNSAITAKKTLNNFRKPSPDDIVLQHQKNALGNSKLSNDTNTMNQDKMVDDKVITKSLDDLKVSDDILEHLQCDSFADDQGNFHPVEQNNERKRFKKATVPTVPKNPINIDEFIQNKKPHISFVVLGHVDAGKSTLMGRLLYELKVVDSNLVRKLKRESEVVGKSSFHLAWIMDQTSEERNRGVTVDICTVDFETDSASFTIVDAPGHRDFVPNAIAGIRQADIAVLSIDCGTDAFESGFNLDGQTKEHALLARSLGIKHIIVAMNKMDTITWSETRFMDIKRELQSFFTTIGIKDLDTSWIPCSGLSGEGVLQRYPITQTWYNGPTLIDQLESVAQRLGKMRYIKINDPFIYSIFDVIPGRKNNDLSVSGRVDAGCIQVGESITIYPSEQSALVMSISKSNNKKLVEAAIPGDFVNLKLQNVYSEYIQNGDIASIVGKDISNVHEFTVQILTFDLERPLLPGTPFILFKGCSEQPARIKKLLFTVDKNDPTKVLKNKVRHLGSYQAAFVEVELIDEGLTPIITVEENRHLAKVVLRKEGRTIGAGIIKSANLKQ